MEQNKLKSLLRSNENIKLLWDKVMWMYAKSKLHINDYDYTNNQFMKIVGKELNLEHPTTFSEKLQYLKLKARNPLITDCTDKVKVRDYVISCGYEHILNKVYGVFEIFDSVDFDFMPERFFIKCNHMSGANYYWDKLKSNNYKLLKKKFDFYMKKNFYVMQREWNYKNIKPMIICEQILEDKNGHFPKDYKFFCFNGEPKLLMYCEGLCNEKGERGHAMCNFYDMDFILLDLKINNDKITTRVIEKPQNFEEMQKIARVLSAPFPFSRVDLYNLEGKIVFGELTFYHAAGLNIISPERWESVMGSWLDIKDYVSVDEIGKD